MMTDDSAERGYLLTLQGVTLVTMVSDGDVAMRMKIEIAEIVTAWWHGRLLPRREAPTATRIFDLGEVLPEPEAEPAPITIAGGIVGLQKHLVALADKNRGLDPAAVKELFNEHQVVIAVWRSSDAPGVGFLTLKGTEGQARRKEILHRNDDGDFVQ
jgi:hypothetical protein